MKPKTCKDCGLDFPATTKYFYRLKVKDKYYLRGECKLCTHKRNRLRYNTTLEAREQQRLRTNKYRKTEEGKLAHQKAMVKYQQTDKGKACSRKHYQKYKGSESHKSNMAKAKAVRQEGRNSLVDKYVSYTITRKWSNLLPLEIIKVKRQQLLLFRTLKQLKNELSKN